MYQFLQCAIFTTWAINITGRHFVVCLFSCVTFAAALNRANRGRPPPLLSPLARYRGCGASSTRELTDPVQGLPGRGGPQRRLLMTPEYRKKKHPQNQGSLFMFHTASMTKKRKIQMFGTCQCFHVLPRAATNYHFHSKSTNLDYFLDESIIFLENV